MAGIRIGVDYYPEQWDKALWKQDIEDMAQAGVKVVRLGEFAWCRMEPEEGRFDFEWLDEVIDLLEEKQMEVVLCTPTNTPPQWLFEKYPEVIQVDKSGHRISIGIRGHRCYNSPVYRKLCGNIIDALVSRYKDRKSVICYQIDNELEANHCCCPVCEESFRTWMKQKYGTIQNVNKAYGNSVWSGEFSSFSQIRPPFGPFEKWLNPSHTLDFERYASDSTIDYVKFQIERIRAIVPEMPITTNTWFCEHMPDFTKMFEGFSFVSYDNYPVARIPQSKKELYSHSFHLDFMRGIKRQNFWIMEQLSGSMGSWMPMTRSPYPGTIKGYALQAIAHGADTVVHFRWRTGCSGAEMYWHGIIDHNHVKGRRYNEFCELCEEVKKLEVLEGSTVRNQVAMIYSMEQEYAFRLQRQSEGMYYLLQLKALHDGFTQLGVGVDIIDEQNDFSKYQVILAPNLYLSRTGTKEALEAFAQAGGTVVLTQRCGVKEMNNQCVPQKLPGIFSSLSGATVAEYDALGPEYQQLFVKDAAWKQIFAKMCECYPELNEEIRAGLEMPETDRCSHWCDILEVEVPESGAVKGNCEVMLEYDGDYYKGSPAVTRHRFGAGTVYYIGTVLSRLMYLTLADAVAKESGLSYIEGLPLGVEITMREKGTKQWRFIFNNTQEVQTVSLPDGTLELAPFEMKVQEA